MLTSIQRGKGTSLVRLLVVVAEVVGASLTTHVDRRLHVMPLAPSHATYYPFLLVGVKVAAALALAALLARITRLRATGRRAAAARGAGHPARRSCRGCGRRCLRAPGSHRSGARRWHTSCR